MDALRSWRTAGVSGRGRRTHCNEAPLAWGLVFDRDLRHGVAVYGRVV